MALAERTLDLVNIASESRSEAAAYDYVFERIPLTIAYEDGESAIFAKRDGKPLVLLAGHLDTVPAQGNFPGRIEDGAVIEAAKRAGAPLGMDAECASGRMRMPRLLVQVACQFPMSRQQRRNSA